MFRQPRSTSACHLLLILCRRHELNRKVGVPALNTVETLDNGESATDKHVSYPSQWSPFFIVVVVCRRVIGPMESTIPCNIRKEATSSILLITSLC